MVNVEAAFNRLVGNAGHDVLLAGVMRKITGKEAVQPGKMAEEGFLVVFLCFSVILPSFELIFLCSLLVFPGAEWIFLPALWICSAAVRFFLGTEENFRVDVAGGQGLLIDLTLE